MHSHPTQHDVLGRERGPVTSPRPRASRSRLARRAPLAALTAVLAAAALPAAADASFAGVVGGQLQITEASAENNAVTVTQFADGRLRATDTRGIRPGSTGCEPDGTVAVICSGANRVLAFLNQGGDSFFTTASVPTQFIGGPGDDVYAAGNAPGPLQVDFSGGSGRDRVLYAGVGAGVTVTKDEAANDGRTGRGDRDNIRGDVEELFGTPFGDSLNGSQGSSNERFFGLAGNDVMTGGPGLDVFVTEAQADGADRMFGGDDVDSVLYTSRTRAVTVNLSDGGADDGEAGEGDELRQIEDARTGSGNDILKAHPDATIGVTFISGGGGDTITGTNAADRIDALGGGRDTVNARDGADVITTRDDQDDSVACGPGVDTLTADSPSLDLQAGCDRVQDVGRLGLTPKALQAKAGKAARVNLSWRHPQGWRRLKTVTLRLTHEDVAVGEVTIQPRDQRIEADGVASIARRATRLDRRGRTATARLGLRIDASMAGRKLELEVEAADAQGRRQIERSAGVVRAAK